MSKQEQIKEVKELMTGFNQNDLVDFVNALHAYEMAIPRIYFDSTTVEIISAKFTIEVEVEFKDDSLNEDFWVSLAQGKDVV